MLKRFLLISIMLPLFATCQEIDPKTVETVIHEEEITVVDYKYVDAFTKKEYSIITVPSLEKYVGEYFKFLEKYNDSIKEEILEGVRTCLDPY